MRRLGWMVMVVALLLAVLAGAVVAQDAPSPTSATVVGTLAVALGCSSDADPACEAAALAFDDEDQLWAGVFSLPAGSYTYQVALDGNMDVLVGERGAIGGAPITVTLAEDGDVHIVFDPDPMWLTDSVSGFIANVPGSYQAANGCPGDWSPGCLQTILQDADGDGKYTYTTTALPAGSYEAKVAYNETWDLNYGDGGAPGGPNIPFTVNEDGQEVVFQYDPTTHVMMVIVGGELPPAVGNLKDAAAIWVTEDTIAWNISRIPGADYALVYSPTASLDLTDEALLGGEEIPLTYDRNGMTDEILAQNPQLADDYFALKLPPEALDRVPELLTGQLALTMRYNNASVFGDATSVQIWGVLDDIYAEAAADEPLGVVWDGDTPTLHVWAPTAQGVRLHRFADSDPATEPEVADMTLDPATGIWSITGEPGWKDQYYLYEVTVYAPTEQGIVTNLVTDPYSVSLSMNSTRSQMVDLNDPALFPEGWADMVKPALAAPEDIALYELHVRDFSATDEGVAPENRGLFTAFADEGSQGMAHLRELADAGLTHVHLLPSFDMATINENVAERQEPDRPALEALPPDSPDQQALVNETRDVDAFNWGYDPLHYIVPEGSYSTNPDGPTRILEYREMVQALNESGLRVVMDVVYNHTNAAGQSPLAVLDRIVPGYYHRLTDKGRVESSTCCANTATEHAMMEKLMLDSLRTWATEYRVDGFRFDLMGHHMLSNMVDVRTMLDSLTLEADGVDGQSIYVYGEGWNFGEVAGNARGINATQLNIAGTGIGVFNDRLRDAARGGSPFSDVQEQGFATGLYDAPNAREQRTSDEQLARLFTYEDWIRAGLAGSLADFRFVNAAGEEVSAADVDYNGNPAGYTADPQENINYVSAHDNETIWDAVQLKSAEDLTLADRIRMNNLALSLVALGQGVPFFHAGDDILRSKSMDRDSYNSGDWFNSIDWTLNDNNWGHGLPIEDKNGANWDLMATLLGDPNRDTTQADAELQNAMFREWLEVRFSSPLFRLQTATDIMDRLTFFNVGPHQVPGVIGMRLSDLVGDDLDPAYQDIVVIFNATGETQSLPLDGLTGDYMLHPVLANSADAVVKEAAFDAATGSFTLPPRTTAVFVLPQ
ncbi:MAG: pullulanase-type alpha-1,6-glucosidase [Anaerolineae bacterium]